MSEKSKQLSTDATELLEKIKGGRVLWFSDAGEYPDRFWFESTEGEDAGSGQQVNVKVVTELQNQNLIESDSGDSYRQRWRLVNQVD